MVQDAKSYIIFAMLRLMRVYKPLNLAKQQFITAGFSYPVKTERNIFSWSLI